MKSPDENSLLKEILKDEKLAEVRRASLDASLALIRRRRRTRHALQFGALALFATLGAEVFLRQPPRPSIVASNQTNEVAVPPKAQPEPPVKAITDEELFALFPDRAVALIGKPGQQEFVVLNTPVRN